MKVLIVEYEALPLPTNTLWWSECPSDAASEAGNVSGAKRDGAKGLLLESPLW